MTSGVDQEGRRTAHVRPRWRRRSDPARAHDRFGQASSLPIALPFSELTVVVPTYNERGNVETLVQRLSATFGEIDWHVVFVDDDSPDGTADLVKQLASRNPRVTCIRRVGRRGPRRRGD